MNYSTIEGCIRQSTNNKIMNNKEKQIISEALKILNARPENKKGIRHFQVEEFLKEIVLPELEKRRSVSDNFATPMKINVWGE